jgi:Spy/CpxP family protein refolding chaperone
MKNLIFGIVMSALAAAAFAAVESPYVGQEGRQIKALSPQEVDGYLNGKGLGYAKAAELNHYPGPRHVLDAAKELNLTQEQITRTQAVFDAMKTQATTLGKQLVEKERELDRRFASDSIDTDSLQALLSDIGTLRTKIRYVHLNAHLEQRALLTKHQVKLYDQVRGYGTPNGGEHVHAH